MKHVFTVGTSVLRNFGKRECSELARALEAGELSAREFEEKCNAYEKVLEALRKEPEKMSAELNAFYGAIEKVGDPEEITLLCTDTEAGKFSCCVLKAYLEEKGYGVEAYVIEALGKPGKFYEGLINLAIALPKLLAGTEHYLNLTGGFKPESAFAYAVAVSKLGKSLKGVYYIHEYHRETVFLPLLPVVAPEGVRWSGKLEETVPELKALAEKLERCWKGAACVTYKPLRCS